MGSDPIIVHGVGHQPATLAVVGSVPAPAAGGGAPLDTGWLPPPTDPGPGPAGSGATDALSRESMTADVAELVGVDPDELPVDVDLTYYGLDSLGIMSLVGRWRGRGVSVRFAELIEAPILEQWWALLEGRAVEGPAGPAPVEARPAGSFPLTPVQHAYWIGRGDDQPLGGVSAHFYVELDGADIDRDRLRVAVRALLHRHPLLRTQFLDDGTQRTLDGSPWTGPIHHELRGLPPAAVEEDLDRIRATLSHRKLDVGRGEVLDVQMSTRAEGVRLHLNIDLLVADVLSIRILLDDLAALYADEDADLAPLTYGFPDYLAAQDAARAQRRTADRDYWTDRVPELPGPPELPLDTDPAQVRPARFTRRDHWVSPQQRQRLSERARRHGLTLPMVLATAFAEVLAAWSAQPRFLLNLPMFDREAVHPDVAGLVADFTTLVILDADMSGDMAFADRAAALQARFRSDVAHSDYSGVEVLRDVRRSHPDVAMPAPVVFTSAIGVGDLFGTAARETLGRPGWGISQTPQVWLDHQVVEFDGGLLLNWDAVEELFGGGVLDGMFGAYRVMVEWLAGPVDVWGGVVPSLVAGSSVAVRAGVNATGGVCSGALLHSGFFGWAVREPGRVALSWGVLGEPGAGWLGYGEVASRALVVAGWVAARTSVGEAVGVCLPKGPDQVVAVLGVLAAGRVYVPVGVDQPAARRDRIVVAAGVSVVLDDLSVVVGAEPLVAPVACGDEAVAYVIFTSGSTGEPKGVEITHRAAVNTVEDVCSRFGVGSGDRALAVSALDFDLSVFDIFGVLGVGAGLVLVEESSRREAHRWWELVSAHGVTVWNSVPALLEMLLEAGAGAGLPGSLRLALVSGDWVDARLAARVAAASGDRCVLVGLGGATEAAIWSNAFECGVAGAAVAGHWRSLPYGFPLRNQWFRVVDPRGRDCPDLVVGELWIGGAGVARGYRGDPGRTAEKFVEDRGGRWYRTGDTGRYWPDGTLEFLGRVDHQVKIRGHRIELGEIEAALLAHPQVTAAAAVAFDPSETGGRQLAAVAVTATGQATAGPGPDGELLREFLAQRLPPYAVPTTVLILDALPLTANGKTDRAELTRLAARRPTTPTTRQPPHGRIETELAALWSDLLGIHDISRDDNFITLGGDSLIATRLLQALRERSQVVVPLRTFFSDPTVAALATAVTSADTDMEDGVL